MQLESILDIVSRPAAWRWIVQRYAPGGVVCPACGAPITGERALAAFEAMERTYCRACDRTFRPRSVTPLAGTAWEPEEFVRLLLLDCAHWKTTDIARQLGKSAGCVRDMLERVELTERHLAVSRASTPVQLV